MAIPSMYKQGQQVLVKTERVCNVWNGQLQYASDVAEITEVHVDGYTVKVQRDGQKRRVTKKQIHSKYEG